MTERSERAARAALSALSYAGKRELPRFIARYGAVAAVHELTERTGTARWHQHAMTRLDGADPWGWANDIVHRTERLGARILIPGDRQWPTALADLADLSESTNVDLAPPLCLWVSGPGDLSAFTCRAVAVVGARASTPYGVHVARELGYDLAGRGWAVVSGAAYGIDAAAHRGALAAHGPTIAVLGCGLDVPYPVGNIGLLEQLNQEALVISEWPPGTRPSRHRFLVRNRVIAALSAGTVVVEAAQRSGSRVTARYAVELGRPLMAVPGPVTSALSAGAHELIRQWRGELVTEAQHVIDIVGVMGEGLASMSNPDVSARDQLSTTERTILDAFPARDAASIAQLSVDSGESLRQVCATLPTLLLKGWIKMCGVDYQITSQGRQAK